MDFLEIIGDTVVYVLVPVVVIAWLSGRLLGTRHSFGTSLLTGLAGYLIGCVVLLGPDLARGDQPSRLDLFAISVLITMMLLTAIELLRGPGERRTGWLRRARLVRRRTAALRRTSEVLDIAHRNGIVASGALTRRRRQEMLGTMPERLRRTLEESGGTLVKLGQVASTRGDVLPAEYEAELSKLTGQAEPAPVEEMRAALDEDLGRPIDEVFAEFDWTPIGSASIAQAYRARLRSGDEVVVKVQRPAVADTIQADARALKELALVVDERSASPVGSQLAAFVEEFAANLIEELDFRTEAANAHDIASVVADDDGVFVPTVYDRFTTERVIVSELAPGVPSSELDALGPDVDRALAATRLFRSFVHQALEVGVFHGDPHPGNIFVTADAEVFLIDFGAVGRLDPQLLDGLRSMLIAAKLGDPIALSDAVSGVVGGVDPRLESGLQRALSRYLGRYGRNGGAGPAALVDMLKVISDFGLEIPPELTLLGRSLVTISGTLREIDPDFDMVSAASEVAQGWSDENLTAPNMSTMARDEVLRQLPTLRALPRELQHTLRAANGTGVALRLSWLSSPEDRSVLTSLLNRAIVAVFAPMLLIGSGLMLYLDDLLASEGETSYLELVGMVGVFISSVLLLRLVIVIARDGLSLDSN